MTYSKHLQYAYVTLAGLSRPRLVGFVPLNYNDEPLWNQIPFPKLPVFPAPCNIQSWALGVYDFNFFEHATLLLKNDVLASIAEIKKKEQRESALLKWKSAIDFLCWDNPYITGLIVSVEQPIRTPSLFKPGALSSKGPWPTWAKDMGRLKYVGLTYIPPPHDPYLTFAEIQQFRRL